MNGEGKPVVALDIDGTLGDYHANFLAFAKLYFGYPEPEKLWTGENPGLPMWDWMGISRRNYRDAKLAYRQGGWKRWMPCYDGASDMTKAIRAAGAEVWLCTTRPYLRLDNVDPDTREWLRRNKIQYDALLFEPVHEDDGSKYHELARQVDPSRVVSVVEDLPEMALAAYDAGFRRNGILMMDQPYNRQFKAARRCWSIADVWAEINKDLGSWNG